MNPWVQGTEEGFRQAWSGRWRVAGSTAFITFCLSCLVCGGIATLLERSIGLPSMAGRVAMLVFSIVIVPIAVTVIVVVVRVSNPPTGMVAARCLWQGVRLRYQPNIVNYDTPDYKTPADWIAWPIGLRRTLTLPCYASDHLFVADLVIDGAYIRLLGVRPSRPGEHNVAVHDPSIRYDNAARLLTVEWPGLY